MPGAIRLAYGCRVTASTGVVVEQAYSIQTQAHTTLEPHGTVARWTSDGKLEVWMSTQGCSWAAEDLAELYELERSAIRLRCDFIGGGFLLMMG